MHPGGESYWEGECESIMDNCEAHCTMRRTKCIKDLIHQLIANGEDGLSGISTSNISAINEWLDQLATSGESGSRRKR